MALWPPIRRDVTSRWVTSWTVLVDSWTSGLPTHPRRSTSALYARTPHPIAPTGLFTAEHTLVKSHIHAHTVHMRQLPRVTWRGILEFTLERNHSLVLTAHIRLLSVQASRDTFLPTQGKVGKEKGKKGEDCTTQKKNELQRRDATDEVWEIFTILERLKGWLGTVKGYWNSSYLYADLVHLTSRNF